MGMNFVATAYTYLNAIRQVVNPKTHEKEKECVHVRGTR